MQDIIFSVILPTYNRAHLLPKAIQSVCDQKLQNWELILIDDGSTDNTKNVVAAFKDVRIKYVWQENQERSTARNNGIALAKGRYICFLDSDDYFLPEHLANIFAKIEKHNFPEAVFMTGMDITDINGKVLRFVSPLPEKEDLHIFILENLLTVFSNPLAVHKSIFTKYKYAPRFSLWEDTHLWVRVLREFPLYQIPQCTVVNIAHEESGIVKAARDVSLRNVGNYKNAIDDLFTKHQPFNKLYSLHVKYLDGKFRMYLYQARQNRQMWIAFQICFMAVLNKPSTYLISEFLKIPLNAVGVGLDNSNNNATIKR